MPRRPCRPPTGSGGGSAPTASRPGTSSTRPAPRLGFEEIAAGGGWRCAGRGVFTETITVAADGATLASEILYEAFGEAGEPVAGGGMGTGRKASGCGSEAGLGAEVSALRYDGGDLRSRRHARRHARGPGRRHEPGAPRRAGARPQPTRPTSCSIGKGIRNLVAQALPPEKRSAETIARCYEAHDRRLRRALPRQDPPCTTASPSWCAACAPPASSWPCSPTSRTS